MEEPLGVLLILAFLGAAAYIVFGVLAKERDQRSPRQKSPGLLTSLIRGLVLGGRGARWAWRGTRNLLGRTLGRTLVLSPGSHSPSSPGADHFDYRGIAAVSELADLREGVVRLGRYLRPRGRPTKELFLPVELLPRNVAVIGSPGSGKTESIIIPWTLQLLRAGYSVATVDVKGDLIDRLDNEARRFARLWYWNSADSARSLSWNWLDGIRDARDLEAAAQSVLGRPRLNDPQPFFHERDYRWLRALVGITKEIHGSAATPRELYLLVGDQEALRKAFRAYPSVRHFTTEVADLLQFSPDEHSRAVSGLLNALHLFNTPEVARISDRSDFRLPGIGKKPTLLVIGASLADARAAEVLSSLMLNQLFTFIYRRFSPGGSGTPLPLVFMIDEAARLKERINYEEVLSVARAADVGICLALQNVGQLGKDQEVSAVLDNCLTCIVLRGSSPDTARYLSARLGERWERQTVVSRQRGPFDPTSERGASYQAVSVPVLREREIMYPPATAYAAVAQVSPVSPKPFLVELLPWEGT